MYKVVVLDDEGNLLKEHYIRTLATATQISNKYMSYSKVATVRIIKILGGNKK